MYFTLNQCSVVYMYLVIKPPWQLLFWIKQYNKDLNDNYDYELMVQSLLRRCLDEPACINFVSATRKQKWQDIAVKIIGWKQGWYMYTTLSKLSTHLKTWMSCFRWPQPRSFEISSWNIDGSVQNRISWIPIMKYSTDLSE